MRHSEWPIAGTQMAEKLNLTWKATVGMATALALCLGLQASPAMAGDNSKSDATYEESIDHFVDKNVSYGAETSNLTWHGYLNFEFDAQQSTNSNFDNHEFYLSAQSKLSDRVSLTAEFAYEHTPEKLITPVQAFADFKFSDALIFRVGQFYTPMGISRSYNMRGNKNRMIRQVALTNDIMFGNWSEIGINLFGKLGSNLYYDVAVGNGMPNTLATGDSFFDSDGSLTSHSEDNNHNKAIHSRFGFVSQNVFNGELNLGFSYGAQKYDPADLKEMTHTGGDIRYLHSTGFRIQAEYMVRDGDDDSPLLAATGISAKAKGWYFQASKRFVSVNNEWVNYIEPVFQIDYIDLNTGLANDATQKRTTAIGLIYSPEPFYMFKFEYDIVTETGGAAVDNNVFWASVVMEF